MVDKKNVLNKKVNSLMKDLSSIKKTMDSLGGFKGVMKKEIRPFGNSCHIILPKEFLNKRANVIITGEVF